MSGLPEVLIMLLTFVLPLALVFYLVIVLQRIARSSDQTVTLLQQLLAATSESRTRPPGLD